MIAGFGWLLVGALIGAGHWAAASLPVIGGVCAVLALVLLGCISIHAATWAIRREKEIELTAQAGPDDTAPLTAYERAVLAALTGTQTHQTNGSSE
jgi:hypothetical protein